MLPTIAMHIMGKYATTFVAGAMLLSCLTTAVALNNIYARYLCSLFRLSKTGFAPMLVATTGVSCLISMLDFRGIAAFLAPALEVSYPSIILLTILGIIKPHAWEIPKKLGFYLLLAAMCVMLV
jgi:LIVCS family branched-chain amino acid:cation transporter